jgi:tripartite-type tricarboxylate transporter receptor subunit TctC
MNIGKQNQGGAAVPRRWIAALLGAALLALAPVAGAQGAYPARPVRLVVPFAPGGATDVIARLIAQKLGDALNGSVIVDNKPGAGSMLGTDLVAKSTPDGYTLVVTNGAAITTGPMISANIAYKPMEDFVHFFLIGTFPNALVVRTEHPARTLAELLAMARAKGTPINFASAGIGSAGFFTGELLKQVSKVEMMHIPYKGTGPATIDLLGGQIDAMFDGLPTAIAAAKAGKERILAVTSAKRVAVLPEVPAINEVVPGVAGEAWFGIAAPARTPAPVVERLQGELQRIVAQPATAARLVELGMIPLGTTGAEVGTFLQAENKKWAPVVEAARIPRQ